MAKLAQSLFTSSPARWRNAIANSRLTEACWSLTAFAANVDHSANGFCFAARMAIAFKLGLACS